MSNFKRMLEKMVEDQRRWQDQMEKMLEPTKILQEQMKKMLGPDPGLRAAMEKMLEPTKTLQEQMKKMLGPDPGLRATMEKMLEPTKNIQEQMKKMLGPDPGLRVAMEKMLEPTKNIQERWLSEVQKHWAAHADIYFSGLPPNAINVTPSGNIVLGRKTVTSEDVAKNLALLDKQLETVSTPVDCFRCIFSFLSRLSMPLARILFFILYTYMMGVLINLTTPIYQPWWEELTGLPKEEVATKIRENALNRYDPSQLKDHRFVTANRLQIRAAPGKEQRVIGTLPRGKLVKVIRSKQHWTKVEYLDERQQKERQGWVATSHLGKLTN